MKSSREKILARVISAVMAIVICVGLAASGSVTAEAMTFKDIPASHWAYAAVNRVSNWGLMVGDLEGNFRPNDFIDKFDTSRVLARILGYKSTGATATEQQYYEQCYNNRKTYITLYVNKFKRWNTTANYEIAYLLEKGVLAEEDLNQFVIVSNNEERLRALNREEIAVFLVRLLGRTNTALSTPTGAKFADDASISSSAKPYVYYLRSIGVISGDSSNSYNPKDAVTRATLAVFIDKIYPIINPSVATTTPSTSATPTSTPTTPSSNYETISGTIVKLYPALKAVEIASTDAKYNNKILLTSSSCIIRIGSDTKTFTDLTENSAFSGVVSNNELISITVGSTAVATPTPITSTERFTIEGIVNATRTAGGNYIDIDLQILNPRGEVTTQTYTLLVTSGTTIKRGDTTVSFASILKGDIVTAVYSGNTAVSLTMDVKDKTVTGTLVDKKILELTNTPILVVEDSTGKQTNFKVTANSKITRRTLGTISWNELRIGDSITVTSQYDAIVTADASGSLSNAELTIESLTISRNEAYVMARNTNGIVKKYPIIPTNVDAYSIRVGSKIVVRLDSQEILYITSSTAPTSDIVMGTVTSVTRTTITIRVDNSTYNAPRDYQYNDSTIFTDARTGGRVTSARVDVGMVVTISVTSANSTLATAVTILQY